MGLRTCARSSAPPCIASMCMKEWDESWTQVAVRGWLHKIDAHASGCQIVCVGSWMPAPGVPIVNVAWHIVLPVPNLGWLPG